MKNGYLSVDLGGTNIACAVADEHMNFLGESSVPTESHLGPEGVIARIGDAVEQLCAQHEITPLGLGIGVPGLAEIDRGRTLFLPNFPGQWRGIDVAEPLCQRLACPVSLLNDARIATLGELKFGAGKDKPNLTFAFFTLGTGIGGGIAIDGKLRLGPYGAAAELGHQTILPDGPSCGCGSRGCLETLASGTTLIGKGAWLVRSGRAPILRDRVNGDLNRISPLEMSLAAQAGDEVVREVIIEVARYLGIGVANVVNTIHPELVILGGGVAKIGDLLFDTVRETVNARIGMLPPESIRIEASTLGSQAGTWGGLALAVDPILIS